MARSNSSSLYAAIWLENLHHVVYNNCTGAQLRLWGYGASKEHVWMEWGKLFVNEECRFCLEFFPAAFFCATWHENEKLWAWIMKTFARVKNIGKVKNWVELIPPELLPSSLVGVKITQKFIFHLMWNFMDEIFTLLAHFPKHQNNVFPFVAAHLEYICEMT